MWFGIRLGLAVMVILVRICLVVHMLLHIIELAAYFPGDPEYGNHQLKNHLVKNIGTQCKQYKS
jgi:hypothetical protein